MKKFVNKKLVITLAFLFVVIVFVCIFKNYMVKRALFDAVEKGDVVTTRELIGDGANVNAERYSWLMSLLHERNDTPLTIACRNGDYNMIELLIQNGADLNQSVKLTGWLPLFAAVSSSNPNRFKIAAYMISQGANINLKYRNESIIEHTVYIHRDDNEQTQIEGFELFKYLIENGVDTSLYYGSENLLTYAVRYKNFNVVEYLIVNGYYDINCTDKAGDTPIDVAIRYNDSEMIRFLVELGAKNADISS